MRKSRVIPCLTILDGGLVKTRRFRAPRYVGDPINAVKIFNEKEVDELLLLDIGASRRGTEPDFALVEEIASEAFMPIAYGGGIRSLEQAARLSALGVENIVLDSAAIARPGLVGDIAARLGRSSTVVSITVRRDWLGRPRTFDPRKRKMTGCTPREQAVRMEREGAGEIMINDADRDGTGIGFDLALVRDVAEAIDVPLIACGGAGTVSDLAEAVGAGASAVAAGQQFVFVGPHRAVLITYPGDDELARAMP